MTTSPTDPAAVKPVAWACEADIRALKYPGDDISLSTEPLPRFGMKMPLYDASYGDQREKAAVERVVAWLRGLEGAQRMMMPKTIAFALEEGQHLVGGGE